MRQCENATYDFEISKRSPCKGRLFYFAEVYEKVVSRWTLFEYRHRPLRNVVCVAFNQFSIRQSEQKRSVLVFNRIVIDIKTIHRWNYLLAVENGFLVSGNNLGNRYVMTALYHSLCNSAALMDGCDVATKNKRIKYPCCFARLTKSIFSSEEKTDSKIRLLWFFKDSSRQDLQ